MPSLLCFLNQCILTAMPLNLSSNWIICELCQAEYKGRDVLGAGWLCCGEQVNMTWGLALRTRWLWQILEGPYQALARPALASWWSCQSPFQRFREISPRRRKQNQVLGASLERWSTPKKFRTGVIQPVRSAKISQLPRPGIISVGQGILSKSWRTTALNRAIQLWELSKMPL
jgi:hypothetical protein